MLVGAEKSRVMVEGKRIYQWEVKTTCPSGYKPKVQSEAEIKKEAVQLGDRILAEKQPKTNEVWKDFDSTLKKLNTTIEDLPF